LFAGSKEDGQKWIFFPNEESDFAKTDENGRTLELLKAQRGEKFPD
jgi:hypothetical protein